MTSEAWQHEGSPLIVPLNITTSRTATIQGTTPSLAPKHVWELCASGLWKVGQLQEQGGEKETGKQWRRKPGAPCRMRGRVMTWHFFNSLSPEQSCLSDQHISRSRAQGTGQRTGQRPSTEGRQLCVLTSVIVRQKAESWSLAASPPRSRSLQRAPALHLEPWDWGDLITEKTHTSSGNKGHF